MPPLFGGANNLVRIDHSERCLLRAEVAAPIGTATVKGGKVLIFEKYGASYMRGFAHIVVGKQIDELPPITTLR